MPKLTVEGVGTFDVDAGKRLVLALEQDARIDQLHACGGRARCTTCRVEFIAGEPPEMRDAERTVLAAKGLTGVRLSCQILCDHDMEVRAISRLAGSGRADAGPTPAAHLEPLISVVIESALLVHAYRHGIFPMAMEDDEIGWFSPDPRGVLPLDAVHVPARLARVIRSQRFEVGVDRDFEGVMRACAADRDEGTWISEEIIESYVALHRQGIAHSIEAWRSGRLVGGLYGVHLGGAFFGESMFHHETDASKVALVALVGRLREHGCSLLDIQWVTPHLARFGAIEIPRAEYLSRLHRALAQSCTFV